MFETTEFIGEMRVSSPMLTLPDGMMTLPAVTARITSSGDMPYDAQPIRIDANHDRALAAAERRRRRQARQRRELRPHAVQREILDLAEAAALAREHQVADRHRAGVEAHDERADGAGRHERARAIDVADRLRQRLRHVGAGMKRQLQQAGVLDRLRLDALDAVDVEEVVLVVVDDVPLHLRRAHAAVRLRDVDDRQIEIRERCRRASGSRQTTAVSATAITATRTVMGRRSAARISHIGQRTPADGFSSVEERRQRAARDGLRQQRAPHVDPRDLVLHFGLREQALRVGDFDDARQPGLVAGAWPALRSAGRRRAAPACLPRRRASPAPSQRPPAAGW